MAPHAPCEEVGLDLALSLALVQMSMAPLLLLDSDLDVIAASASFCAAFQIDPAGIAAQPLSGLGAGEWNVAQLSALLKATAAGYAAIENYEMDLVREGRPTRRLVVNATKLQYADGADIRLVLSVLDVTEARIAEKLKDDLLREKDVLLQELQHRVANSLQIIASVLLQSARKVQSEETRSHLHDAHHRVMSVAALQQQLAASKLGECRTAALSSKPCAKASAPR